MPRAAKADHQGAMALWLLLPLWTEAHMADEKVSTETCICFRWPNSKTCDICLPDL